MYAKTIALLGLTLTLAACTTGGPAAPSATPSQDRPPTPAPTPTAPGTTSPTRLPSPAPADPSASNGTGLTGRQFLSTSLTEDGAPRPLVPGTTIRLTFNEDTLSAHGGCNTIGGNYTVQAGKLVFTGGHMTEMACDEARMAQDQWLVNFLGSQPAISLDGDDLTLTGASITISLLDSEVAEPDQALAGPTWTLTSVITGDAVSSVPADVVATLRFDDSGGVEIQPGCNSGSGRYAVDGESITFSDLITTKMACMGAAMNVENTVLELLSAESLTFAIDAGSLTIMADGNGLQFSAG